MEQAALVRKAVALCGGTQAALAKRIGCAQQTINKLVNSEIGVSVKMALAIHRATNGKVSARELRPDWPWPEAIS